MGLLLGQSKSSANRPQAPEGNHPAICVQVLDLGTQKGDWQGKPKLDRKIRLAWELPEEKAVFSEEKGEQPFLVSRTYNFSTSEKSTFRQTLESWRGKVFTDEELKTFDIENLLGVGGMVTIVTNDRGYSDVKTVTALPKQMKALMPKPENKPVYWSIEDGRNDTFKALPEFLQKIASECQEWNTEGPDDFLNPEAHQESDSSSSDSDF